MKDLIKLTKKIATEKVEKIKNMCEDDEVAHIEEDKLHLWFIRCIAAGLYKNSEAVEVAKIVQSTSEIEFCRWYA